MYLFFVGGTRSALFFFVVAGGSIICQYGESVLMPGFTCLWCPTDALRLGIFHFLHMGGLLPVRIQGESPCVSMKIAFLSLLPFPELVVSSISACL